MARYIAFDLEISKQLPEQEQNLLKHRRSVSVVLRRQNLDANKLILGTVEKTTEIQVCKCHVPMLLP